MMKQGIHEFRLLKWATVAATCAVAMTGQAKWTANSNPSYVTDGAWKISIAWDNAHTYTKTGDGEVVGSTMYGAITEIPEGGGDLDMSTLVEDVGGESWLTPKTVGPNFLRSYMDKVTSVKFPSNVVVVRAEWTDKGSTAVLTNVVFGANTHTLGDYLFKAYVNLQTVSGLENVKYIGWQAFDWCKSLRTVTPLLPTGLVSVADNAFNCCFELTGDLVLGSAQLRTISMPLQDSKITSVTYGEGVTNIAVGWYNCTSITNFAPLPASLETLPTSFASGTKCPMLDFSACTNLTEIPNDIAYSSTALKSVRLPPRIKKIGLRAFKGCWALTNVTYAAQSRYRDEMVSANGLIEEEAFRWCTGLQELDIPWGGSGTVIGNNAFLDCSSLAAVRFAGPPPSEYPAGLFILDGQAGEARINYRLHLYVPKRDHAAAWRAFATTLGVTDAEKARADYPGDQTFGTFDSADSDWWRNRGWMVWSKSCWHEDRGLSVILR